MAKRKSKVNSVKSYVIVAVIIVASVLLISLPVLPNIWGHMKTYVFKVNEEKVTQKELKYYIAQMGAFYQMYYGQEGVNVFTMQYDQNYTLGQVIFNNVADTVEEIKLCKIKAPSLGISLDDADKTKAQETLTEFKESFDDETIKYIGMSDAELLKLMEEEILRDKVREQIVSAYVVNEAEYDDYIAETYKKEKATLDKFSGNYMVTDDKDKADEFRAAVDAGGNFDALVADYSNDLPRASEAPYEFNSTNFPTELVTAATALAEGGVTEVIEVTNEEVKSYYVARVSSIEKYDLAKLAEERRENYITGEETKLFDATTAEWRADKDNYTLTTNDVAVSTVLTGMRAGTFRPEPESSDNPSETPAESPSPSN